MSKQRSGAQYLDATSGTARKLPDKPQKLDFSRDDLDTLRSIQQLYRIPALARGVVQVGCSDEAEDDEIPERPKTASGRDAVWSDAAIETERLHQKLIARVEKRSQIMANVRKLRSLNHNTTSGNSMDAEDDGDIAEEIDLMRLADDDDIDDEKIDSDVCEERIPEDLPFMTGATADEYIGC
eukprot:m.862919 g.862919  ORF g.862919 m.862919 type:complete len:182 (-) comp23538_c0_seq3:1017-1562(-)